MALASLADRPPTTRAERTIDRSAPGKVTGRLKRALDAMIWQAMKRADAAKHANLSEHSLYVALRRPHVKAYYLAELEVLRTSERARNIHTLAEVRDQTSNQMARVQAVKALEQLADEENGASGRPNSLPGLQIVIQIGGPQPPTIDVTPNSELAHD